MKIVEIAKKAKTEVLRTGIKACSTYRSVVEVKIVKIAKNDEKRGFGRMNRAL